MTPKSKVPARRADARQVGDINRRVQLTAGLGVTSLRLEGWHRAL